MKIFTDETKLRTFAIVVILFGLHIVLSIFFTLNAENKNPASDSISIDEAIYNNTKINEIEKVQHRTFNLLIKIEKDLQQLKYK